MALEPNDPQDDPFAPPQIPTEVCCIHCGQIYDSSQIEWRVSTNINGQEEGFWCCPVPDCGGVGFGCDILPTDPTYRDEHGGWMQDDDDDEDLDEDWNEEEEEIEELEEEDLLPPPADPHPPHSRNGKHYNGPDEDIPF
jgi:hypothetical protein